MQDGVVFTVMELGNLGFKNWIENFGLLRDPVSYLGSTLVGGHRPL